MKTLVEIHVLQNFAPSNLNRDDTGAPKDALFGGTRRARISSQCMKRAVRQHFLRAVTQNILLAEDVACRTKRLLGALTEALVEKGRPEAEVTDKVRLALAAVELPVKDDGKNEYLLFLGAREIAGLAGLIDKKWDDIVEPEKAAGEGKKTSRAKKDAAKGADPDLKNSLDKVLDGGKAVDLALFGRMLADMPEKNQNAACQVAHAISTHAVEREFDYYTAVDDLKPGDTSGADMMGTVEFTSACFYRYAVIDWDALVQNLQDDEPLAEKGLRTFLEGFILAEPTGKQNTFAAHNPPEFVAVSVRHNAAPRNLANAFEMAVHPGRGESLTRASACSLMGKARQLEKAYSGGGRTFVLDLTGAAVDGFGETVDSLQMLMDKAMAARKE